MREYVITAANKWASAALLPCPSAIILDMGSRGVGSSERGKVGARRKWIGKRTSHHKSNDNNRNALSDAARDEGRRPTGGGDLGL